MATCQTCQKPTIFLNPNYCKEHFLNYFEQKVHQTITDYQLIPKNTTIAVAVSGGKDSLTTLHVLHKFGYPVVALTINEGIRGYRENTMQSVEKFCKQRGITWKHATFNDAFHTTMDQAAAKTTTIPCNTCGVLRRYLLNKAAKSYRILATGHNLDDEAQAIFMNLLNGNLGLNAKLGPKTGLAEHEGFTQRIKPLYFCSEKEVMTYAYLNGIYPGFNECPYAQRSLRFKIRDHLNDLEAKHPGTKKTIIENFLTTKPLLTQQAKNQTSTLRRCSRCHEPAANEVCNACHIQQTLPPPETPTP